jgi:ceramide glucosyltransferase
VADDRRSSYDGGGRFVIAMSPHRHIAIRMTASVIAAASFCAVTALLHTVSIIATIIRCRPRPAIAPPRDAPPVTIVRPVCGLDNFVEETLRTSFDLDYPEYELIFCVASERDPVVPVVRELIAEFPGIPAKLLVGDDRISTNPKLNNCVKGWRAAAHPFVAIADSNVLMPRDYIQRLLAAWRPDTGLVCSPPQGCRPIGVWANLECAFLNSYQARAQYFADSLGIGFAQGKTMLWRYADLEAAGGIRALAAEVAEDAASTKIVRAAGLRVRLVDRPFQQPLGRRTLKEVWRRQTRWARLRRAGFPLYFLPEAFGGALLPLTAAGIAAHGAGLPAGATVAALAAWWYGLETLLVWAARWPFTPLFPVHAAMRDLLLPALWVDGWIGADFVWRGNAMSVADDSVAVDSPAA